MGLILNPLQERQLGRCFYLVVDLSRAEEEIRSAIQASLAVEAATDALLSGRIDGEDFLEWVEPHVGVTAMDTYIEEVEENLEDLKGIWLPNAY